MCIRDSWNLKLPRAKELCRRLIEEGLNTVPVVTVHGMKVNHTDLELFQLMKAAGCKRVGFGVENGDENMPVSYTHLDVYKRQPLSQMGQSSGWLMSSSSIMPCCAFAATGDVSWVSIFIPGATSSVQDACGLSLIHI